MLSYADVIARKREEQSPSAATPVAYDARSRKKNLTRPKNAAYASRAARPLQGASRQRNRRALKKESPSMARKKARSAKQIAATKRMIRARKAQLRSKSSGGHKAKRKTHRHGRKHARRGTKRAAHRATRRHHKSAKRVKAGKKAARTRKRHLAAKHASARKSRRRHRRGAKDGNYTGAKRPKMRKQPRRRGGGRGVAGTYKKLRSKARKAYLRRHPQNNRPGKTSGRLRVKRRYKARRMTTSKIKIKRVKRHKGMAPGAYAHRQLAVRRQSAGAAYALGRHPRFRRSARENPISWGGVLGVVLLGGIGAIGGELTDRWLATRPLVTGKPANEAGVDTTMVDNVPAGELPNRTAVSAPMNLKRWAAGVAGTVLPIGISAIKMPSGAQTALRGFGLGWGIRTIAKGGTDLVAMLMKGKPTGERLFQPEFAAMHDIASGKSGGGPISVWTGAAGTQPHTAVQRSAIHQAPPPPPTGAGNAPQLSAPAQSFTPATPPAPAAVRSQSLPLDYAWNDDAAE
jgi:hypothetical protein